VIAFLSTKDGKVPEEFSDIPIQIEEELTIPLGLKKKTHTMNP
jgi:hypothetical protein